MYRIGIKEAVQNARLGLVLHSPSPHAQQEATAHACSNLASHEQFPREKAHLLACHHPRRHDRSHPGRNYFLFIFVSSSYPYRWAFHKTGGQALPPNEHRNRESNPRSPLPLSRSWEILLEMRFHFWLRQRRSRSPRTKGVGILFWLTSYTVVPNTFRLGPVALPNACPDVHIYLGT